jgi:hypothetical protein
MPNFKDDKSKFTMKNMNYYKGKHAEGEANSPYNKNKLDGGGRALKAGKTLSAVASNMAEAMANTMTGGMLSKGVSKFGGKTNTADLKNQIAYKETSPEITEEFVNMPVQNFLKGYGENYSETAAEKAGKSVAKSVRNLAEMAVTGRILNRAMKKNPKTKNTGYTPQTKSRKNPSTDITPQSKKK